MIRQKTVQTTIGDLIVALTDATVPYVHNENEANILVAYLLSDILQHSHAHPITWH
jgi:predicted nucleotide-binding protein (sugar kinase/HSP70/actin superfamily)